MTRIAIPLFIERIAPRFDCTGNFLLVEIEDGGIVKSEQLPTEQMSAMARVGKLRDLRVDILICGGIDEVSARRLTHNGIKVYDWITGLARDALTAFLNGDLESGVMVGDAGHRQGRWKLRRKGPHSGEGGRKPRGRGRRARH